jgi:hypothetical protein
VCGSIAKFGFASSGGVEDSGWFNTLLGLLLELILCGGGVGGLFEDCGFRHESTPCEMECPALDPKILTGHIIIYYNL